MSMLRMRITSLVLISKERFLKPGSTIVVDASVGTHTYAAGDLSSHGRAKAYRISQSTAIYESVAQTKANRQNSMP